MSIKDNFLKVCELIQRRKMIISDSLTLNDQVGAIESNSIWGILRGLESFSQMLVLTDDKMTVRLPRSMPRVCVVMEPRK